MNQKPYLLTALSLATLGATLSAQELEVVYIDRAVVYHQTSSSSIAPSEIWDDFVWIEAGADVLSGSISDFKISNGLVSLEIPSIGANEYMVEESFSSLNELNALAAPGQYTLSGTGSSVGEFEITFNMPAHDFFPAKKVTNFDTLQNLDPSQPVTIQWEAFTEHGDLGFIEVEVEYWDGSNAHTIWETPDEQEGLLPALPPTATSVTIPAGVLQGNSNYTVFIYFAKLDTMIENVGPFDGSTLVTVLEVMTHLDIKTGASTQTETWAEWSDNQVDNWVDTEGFLGWIYVGENGWIAQDKLGWIYLPEENVTPSGAWTYLPC